MLMLGFRGYHPQQVRNNRRKTVMHVVTSRAVVRCMGCGPAAVICRQKGLEGSCREGLVGDTKCSRVLRPIDLKSCVSVT